MAGFVLAAGALSLAELGLDAPGAKSEPAVAGDETPAGGPVGTEPAPQSSGAPGVGADASVTSPSAEASGSPSVSQSPTGEEPAEAEDEPGEAASWAPAGTSSADPATGRPQEPPARPHAPADPDDPDPAPTKPEPDPEPEPEPEPEPSETCDRFLWWCT
ncbi:hypothetical protein ACFP50_30580 [Streptomyces pratens]|uniref:Uncharacterized protein n=1 Tax=Streptomyces pratens TaxID=887456 RepID=A0ABW1M8A9_9ACTN